MVQYQLKSILIVPLELNGEAIGAVYLDHRYQPDRFDAQAVTLISAFASQAALALQKSRLIGDLEEARKKLEGRVEEQATRIASLSSELEKKRENLRYGYDEIIGQSPSMIRVFQNLDRITDTTVPVWILGESGTGKELIARSLHENSGRKNKPFVAENVGAIPETLLESELFGHKKGAFTHADRDRVGLFEQANGGTLFLDEIADMPASMQSKLLRVLQEGEIRPVGSSKKIKIDVRIVSASNKDLREMVETGAFRRDLFFRLNGFTVELPPLRERREDIPLLARHMAVKSAKNFNLTPSELTTEALQALMAYDWPGNIRELENVIRNALILARGKPIAPKHLSLPVSSKTRIAVRASSKPASPAVSDIGRKTEADTEKNLIVESLRQNRMDKVSTAKALGISIRTLYTRMEEFDIPKRKAVLANYLGLSEK